jgi:hypothetical protein
LFLLSFFFFFPTSPCSYCHFMPFPTCLFKRPKKFGRHQTYPHCRMARKQGMNFSPQNDSIGLHPFWSPSDGGGMLNGDWNFSVAKKRGGRVGRGACNIIFEKKIIPCPPLGACTHPH